MNKNLFITTALSISTIITTAQKISCYEAEGITYYEVRGCKPGSELLFHSSASGGELIRTAKANSNGEYTGTGTKDFKPAMVLNRSSNTVHLYREKDFILEHIGLKKSGETIFLSWIAGTNPAAAISFSILKSKDGIHYEKVNTIPSVPDKASHQYHYQGENALYKIAVNSVSDGVKYTTGVLQSGENTELKLYPVASSTTINVSIPSGYLYRTFHIISSTGQVAKKIRLTDPVTLLNISDLSSGVYFLIIPGEHQRTARHFIRL